MVRFRRGEIRRAIYTLVLTFVFFRWMRDIHDTAVRESRVDFTALLRHVDLTSWLPDKPIRFHNGSHIDDRYLYLRPLTPGREGYVHLYFDIAGGLNIPVVVKSFSVVSRNEIPSPILSAFNDFTNMWPSEIEATLALGARTIKGQSSVVPVYDYFIMRDVASAKDMWSWALVTELVAGGTLMDLARQVHETASTASQIDRMYRGSFDKFLTDLRSLHDDGYCHDDVKPANIFIHSPRWLLADLGNLRNVDHAWHHTRQWQRRNQLADCRANDVRRALKSYMVFLREASRDEAEFDWNFLAGDEGWSRLYWCLVRGWGCPSEVDPPTKKSEQSMETSEPPLFFGSNVGNLLRRLNVHQELAWNLPRWRVRLRY